jgi:hypothetical protein
MALVRTDVSEDLSASIIRVTRIGELGTSTVTSNRPILITLMMEAQRTSATSDLTRAKRRNIPEDAIPHFVRCLPLQTRVYVQTGFFYLSCARDIGTKTKAEILSVTPARSVLYARVLCRWNWTRRAAGDDAQMGAHFRVCREEHFCSDWYCRSVLLCSDWYCSTAVAK